MFSAPECLVAIATCGSGAIAVAIDRERPVAKVFARFMVFGGAILAVADSRPPGRWTRRGLRLPATLAPWRTVLKGTVEDLLMAEKMASRGHFIDAIKVMDCILGIPAGADEDARLQALKESLESTESLVETLRVEMEERTSLNPTRIRLTADMVSVSVLLPKRMVWLINQLGAEQSEEALLAAVAGAQEINDLLRDHSAAQRIALDDQATLLSVAVSLWFVMDHYDALVGVLLEAAVRRAPANAKLRELIRQQFASCQANLKKDTPSAVAKRERYRAGVHLLTGFVDIVNTAAEIVDSRAFIPFSDVPGAGSAPTPKTLLEMVTKRMADKMKSESEPERAARWAEAVAMARRICSAPDPPHLSAAPSPPDSSAPPTPKVPPKPGLFGRIFTKR